MKISCLHWKQEILVYGPMVAVWFLIFAFVRRAQKIHIAEGNGVGLLLTDSVESVQMPP